MRGCTTSGYKKKNCFSEKVGLLLGLVIFQNTYSLTFELPNAENNIIGEIQSIKMSKSASIAQIAREYDIGYQELLDANPDLQDNKPRSGMRVVIPSAFILPPAPREGIVINIAELRLYFF